MGLMHTLGIVLLAIAALLILALFASFFRVVSGEAPIISPKRWLRFAPLYFGLLLAGVYLVK